MLEQFKLYLDYLRKTAGTVFYEKTIALVYSRRWGVFVGALLLLKYRETLGLSPDDVKLISGLVVTWLISDTIRPTKLPGDPGV